MDRYKIKYSNETKIGGAYDDYHHEIAQIAKHEDGDVRVEFRSRDFYQSLQVVDENTYLFTFEDGRTITVYGEGDNVFIKIGENIVDVTYPDFSYESIHGHYDWHFEDDNNLILKTDSDEIVMAISGSLGLIYFLHR